MRKPITRSLLVKNVHEPVGARPTLRQARGVLKDGGSGRFRYYCASCIFMIYPARTEGVAVKLWNEAKPRGKNEPRAKGR